MMTVPAAKNSRRRRKRSTGPASCRARARASTPRRTSRSDGHIGGTATFTRIQAAEEPAGEPEERLGGVALGVGEQEPGRLVGERGQQLRGELRRQTTTRP